MCVLYAILMHEITQNEMFNAADHARIYPINKEVNAYKLNISNINKSVQRACESYLFEYF